MGKSKKMKLINAIIVFFFQQNRYYRKFPMKNKIRIVQQFLNVN